LRRPSHVNILTSFKGCTARKMAFRLLLQHNSIIVHSYSASLTPMQKRVLILDTDAHAGNGASEYFYQNPIVLFIDLHQDPSTLYLGTAFDSDIGSGYGVGDTINGPLPVYAGCNSHLLGFDEIIQPITQEFKLQTIINNWRIGSSFC